MNWYRKLLQEQQSSLPEKVDMLDESHSDRSLPNTPKLPPMPKEYLEALDGKAVPQNWLWQQRAEGDADWSDSLKSKTLPQLTEEYENIKRGYLSLMRYLSLHDSSKGSPQLGYMQSNDIKYFKNELIRLKSMLKEIENLLPDNIEKERSKTPAEVTI